MYRFFNIFVNKIVNILIVAILILIAFFLGLNTTHALEITDWGLSQTNYINSLTSTSSYTYADYNSDTIKEFIFNRSNEQFFDNTLTQSEFYQRFNYVVMGYSQSTIRVFVQNYERAMNYQGLNAIVGNETRFFFANITLQWRAGSTTFYDCGIAAIYSYYIDINYNTMSYTFSDNNPLTDLEFYRLATGRRYVDSGHYFGSIDINMKLFDSYNGNFSWIEYWNSLQVNDTTYHYIANYTDTYTTGGYYNSIVDFPVLEYVSSGTPDDETPGGGGESTFPDYFDILDTIEDWLSKIEGNTNSSKGFLEGIGETLGKIGQSIGDGLNDLISGISDTLDDINDWFTGGFNDLIEGISDFISDILNGVQSIFDWLTGAFTGYDSIEDFFESITFEDNGGISRIVSAPLDLIRSLINNDSCTPLLLPIWGNDIAVPSGCILWENATDEINTLWHTLICGAGGYFILTSLFKDIEKIKNPKSSEVSTLDL